MPSRIALRVLAGAALVAQASIWASGAAAAGPPAVDLLDLRTMREAPAAERYAPLTAVTFFQPACDWCRRQVKALDELSGRCVRVDAVAVGVFGDVPSLRAEVRGFGHDVPAYRGNPGLLKALDVDVVATPKTIFLDGAGAVAAAFDGFLPLDRLDAIVGVALGTGACR